MFPPLLQTVPSAWRFALIGALASLPVAAIINLLPNSETTISGGVVIIGAFIAGVIAALRVTDPDAAGLRAGFLGGVLEVCSFIVTVVNTATVVRLRHGRSLELYFGSSLLDWFCVLPRIPSSMWSCRRVDGKHRCLTVSDRRERVMIIV